jgi:hypothetical protein
MVYMNTSVCHVSNNTTRITLHEFWNRIRVALLVASSQARHYYLDVYPEHEWIQNEQMNYEGVSLIPMKLE